MFTIGLFAAVQPNLLATAIDVFHSSDWLTWFVRTTPQTFFEVINRNARNTLTACAVGLGLVNLAALAIWAIRDRRLPASVPRAFALLWAVPVLLMCIVWVVGKPGYLLPILPLGAPIGSNRGVKTRDMIRIIIEQARVPVVVDAGLGAPSHAAEAMEMGADAVLVNTALADASDHAAMARAFAMATEAGRMAYVSGLGPVREQAEASSPLTGFLGDAAGERAV